MARTAIYVRVSSNSQDLRSQVADLEKWASLHADDVTWYRDSFTGKSMDRPGMIAMLADVRAGKIDRVVVWRLDRLGRNASGVLQLVEELQLTNVGFLSVRDSIDLSTPTGRLMLVVLAGVASFETEVRRERQAAGIAAARAAGKRWGGRKAGSRIRVTEEREAAIKAARMAGQGITSIAKAVGLSRVTVRKVLTVAQIQK